MTVRLKLKATFVHRLGDDALAETVSANSYQRTLARDHKVDDEPTEDADLPDIHDTIGQYRLVRRLGAGMFGSVYVAERTDVPEHRVALKVINRAVYGERDVSRELVMLAAATHPNIVELKDHGMTNAYVWLTMPLYDGQTLAERLDEGPLGLREAHEIFVPIARGVAALHARGLRHQDIKPENIYLAKFAGQLHPVLLDLGVAVESNSDFIAGTALYGAPEQLAALGGIGEIGELTEQMDCYCLGSTLLYALIGEDHFPGSAARTPFDIVSAFEKRELDPVAPETLPQLEGKPRRMLVRCFQRWLQRDSDARPSMQELSQELDVLLEKERAEVRAAEERVKRQRTLLQRVTGALVAVAMVALGVGYYLFSQRETIRLVNELQNAQAAGQEHFSNLKTCEAGYSMGQQDLRKCKAKTNEATKEHMTALTSISEKHDVVSNQLNSTTTKLQSCEESAEAAKTSWDEERATLKQTHEEEKASWATERTALEQERDKDRETANACELKIETARKETAQCRSDLSTCRSSGDDVYNPVPIPKTITPPAKIDPYD